MMMTSGITMKCFSPKTPTLIDAIEPRNIWEKPIKAEAQPVLVPKGAIANTLELEKVMFTDAIKKKRRVDAMTNERWLVKNMLKNNRAIPAWKNKAPRKIEMLLKLRNNQILSWLAKIKPAAMAAKIIFVEKNIK